jgi:phosphoribosylanthranilate isomerase
VTEVKICGITNLTDAFFAAQVGADALGFNFYPKSPRYVTPEAAKQIIRKIPGRTAKVGVFVNHDVLWVQEIFTFCGLDLVQLHGDEPPEYCGQFASSRVIKAVSLRKDSDLERLDRYPVKAILVDAFDPSLYGGTGKRSDWRLAVKVKDRFPLILLEIGGQGQRSFSAHSCWRSRYEEHPGGC